MNLEIRGLNLQVTESLREHCERRLHFALGRFADRIRRVVVRVEDVNGHRGGVDQGCRLEVVLERGAPVHVESTARSLWAAVDDAAHRAAQAVTRELERERQSASHAA